ncbi:MAG: LemA family protein [Chitinophagaceae bacterium]|nr:LemA family protein [Chitinophagaceae bacterium]
MKSRTGLFVVLGIVVLLFFWGCGSYNGLVGVDQEVKAKWGDVQTNYQRRTDLYSSVIKTISASANFEKSVLTDVVNARAKATSINVDAGDPKSLEAYQQAQAGLQSSFSKLLAVVENYPDIKTTKAFQDFQAQIEGTENRISVSRRDYNTAVQGYNLKVKTFPNAIFAGILGFHEKPFYKSDPGSDKAPDMNFDIK